MHRAYYTFEVEQYTLNQLYRKLRKKRGRAKILASVVVSIGLDDKGNDIWARIVFVRDRNRSKKWLATLATNHNLPEEEVVHLYGKHWDIECFFKVAKSQSSFGKRMPVTPLRRTCSTHHYSFYTLNYACNKFPWGERSKNDWAALLFVLRWNGGHSLYSIR